MSVDLHLRPVVQMLDSTIEIYPEDSVMHLLNNWGPYLSRSINTCLGYRATEPLQDFVLYSAVAPSIISIRRIVGVFRRGQPNVFLFRICLLAPHTCGDLTRTTTSTARLRSFRPTTQSQHKTLTFSSNASMKKVGNDVETENSEFERSVMLLDWTIFFGYWVRSARFDNVE